VVDLSASDRERALTRLAHHQVPDGSNVNDPSVRVCPQH
jgi:hypothetical protein